MPYQNPVVHGPLTVDDLIGDLMVDTSAHHAVLEILDQYDVPGYLKAILFNEPNLSLMLSKMLPFKIEETPFWSAAAKAFDVTPERLGLFQFSTQPKMREVILSGSRPTRG